MNARMTVPTTPRDAATVVVVRDAQAGIEVLLLQRAERNDHNSGAWVFPGGLVDPGDRAADDPQAGLSAFVRAAVRECQEESGIVLDSSQVYPVAHWLTPMGRAKRFNTRFFVAAAAPHQAAQHDGHETTDHVWITPAQALSPRHTRRLMLPTRSTLELLLGFETTRDLLAWAAQPRAMACILPRLALDASGLRPVLPQEPAYDEIAKLDPQGRCDAWCELRPGLETRLGERVVRTVNADGTNRYRVDGAEVSLAAPLLLAEDAMVIARDETDLTASLRSASQWLAPQRGFLRKLG